MAISISDDLLNKLIEHLDEVLNSEELKAKDHRKLEEVLSEVKELEHPKAWEKIRAYLGDAANLCTIGAAVYGAYQGICQLF